MLLIHAADDAITPLIHAAVSRFAAFDVSLRLLMPLFFACLRRHAMMPLYFLRHADIFNIFMPISPPLLMIIFH